MQIKNRQQLLGLLAGTAIALLAADRLVVTPLTKSYRTRAEQIIRLQKNVASGRGLIQRERSLRERWDHMRANTLPNDTSTAEQQMLKAFDKWSQSSRLGLLSISPQWKHDTEEYITLECRVDAAGDLSTVTRFLYDLEKDPMALKLQSLDINSRDDGRQFTVGLQVSGLILTPPAARR